MFAGTFLFVVWQFVENIKLVWEHDEREKKKRGNRR
jgi:hypothetical protein